MTVPKLIIHGGAGSLEGSSFSHREYRRSLRTLIQKAYRVLSEGTARQACLEAVKLLENNPMFNAGTGSKIQKDGQIRMSAAIMDARENRFSAVINIRNVKNPIAVANLLAKETFTILGGNEASDYARSNNFKYYNPTTPHRLQEYKTELMGEIGTVGAVALDRGGNICVATSTGGVGYELPGRIGDSATVAGTYTSQMAGVSCTGKGEHIINQAVAARIVTRVEDGMTLSDSVAKIVEESNAYNYRFGLIALDHHGNMVVGHTNKIDAVLYASYDGEALRTFMD
jgi:L-asparaginase